MLLRGYKKYDKNMFFKFKLDFHATPSPSPHCSISLPSSLPAENCGKLNLPPPSLLAIIPPDVQQDSVRPSGNLPPPLLLLPGGRGVGDCIPVVTPAQTASIIRQTLVSLRHFPSNSARREGPSRSRTGEHSGSCRRGSANSRGGGRGNEGCVHDIYKKSKRTPSSFVCVREYNEYTYSKEFLKNAQ